MGTTLEIREAEEVWDLPFCPGDAEHRPLRSKARITKETRARAREYQIIGEKSRVEIKHPKRAMFGLIAISFALGAVFAGFVWVLTSL